MNYKVIFFDADGLVLRGGFMFTDKLAEKYGLNAKNMTPFFKGPFRECAAGKADLKTELVKVLNDWGWKGTVDELIQFWLTEGTVFDDKTVELARKLSSKGVHCFVATGQEKNRGEFIKSNVGGGDPFEDVFYSAEVGCDKKEKQFFETIFDRVSHVTTDPSEVLFIDDSEHIVDMAKSVGFDAIYYQSPDDIKELIAYVK